MRVGTVPESLAERAVLATGLVPTPFLDTHPTLLLARAVMVATKAGIFEALAGGERCASDLAERCGSHPEATAILLDTLARAGYLEASGDGYRLSSVARRWLLDDSPQSLRDSILFRYLEWDWIARLDDFVLTGRPLDFHAEMSPEEWRLYQRGMASLGRLAAPETVRATPVPKGARDLLDVGGSHGLFSTGLCRRHPRLRAVVFDLPQAVEHSAPLLAEQGLGERVVHRAGDALADDLGENAYDVVLLAQLVHHFDEATNRRLTRRLARALRPGGVLVVQEISRRSSPRGGQLGALSHLYFALTSRSGAWSFEEIADWQREAGLVPRKPVRFRTLPDTGQQSAVKPRRRRSAPAKCSTASRSSAHS